MPANASVLADEPLFLGSLPVLATRNDSPGLDQGENPMFIKRELASGMRVPGTQHRLAKSVQIRVWYEGNTVAATSMEIPMYGHGRSEAEAVSDLLVSLAEMWEMLTEQRGVLAPRLVDQLDLLAALFQSVPAG